MGKLCTIIICIFALLLPYYVIGKFLLKPFNKVTAKGWEYVSKCKVVWFVVLCCVCWYIGSRYNFDVSADSIIGARYLFILFTLSLYVLYFVGCIVYGLVVGIYQMFID